MRTRYADRFTDWVVVDRAVNGYPPGRELTKWERAEAVRRLIARGTPGPVIRERLGVSDTVVQYWRGRARQVQS